MATETYDIVIVGGGLAGAALAKAMAEHGAKVLVVESRTHFKDRVRGESMLPWGMAEARALGIYTTLMKAGAHVLPWWDTYQGGMLLARRDLRATTPQKEPAIGIYHPAMQQALVEAATCAGAQVRQGARVIEVQQADVAVVTIHEGNQEVEVRARLVVGADGRESSVRRWGGFEISRDPDRNFIGGLLFDNIGGSDEANQLWPNPDMGLTSLLFPQGNGRARVYLCSQRGLGFRLSDKSAIPKFINECVKSGVPQEYFDEAQPAGPLATFDGTDRWVEHPYYRSVALIGDAAATSNPTFGQGLSLTLRDVRVLRDRLLEYEDWDEAGHAYAQEHDCYFRTLHTFEDWQSQVNWTDAPGAKARRDRLQALWREDPTRRPDVIFSGPDVELDETARLRFFGEDSLSR